MCFDKLKEACRIASQGGTFCPAIKKCYSSVQVVKVDHDKALTKFCPRLTGGFLAIPENEEEMQHIIDCKYNGIQ